MKSLQKCQKHFERSVLLNAEYQEYDIQSVFIDLKDKERRAIIIIGKEGSLQAVESIANTYFKSHLYKIVQKNDEPIPTAKLKTGKGVRHKSIMGWGTLGGFFKVKSSTGLYGLSNNHVISNIKIGQKGNSIFYSEKNIVAGKLFRRIPLKPLPNINYIDAALFEVNSEHQGEWFPNTPNRPWIGPRPRMKVFKQGYGSDYTEGYITGYNGSATIPFNGVPYHFSGIMAIWRPNGHFTQEGDSGSIVFSSRSNHMVGLVFAKHGSYCWALPISKIKPLLT